jgi:hypothetical protein
LTLSDLALHILRVSAWPEIPQIMRNLSPSNQNCREKRGTFHRFSLNFQVCFVEQSPPSFAAWIAAAFSPLRSSFSCAGKPWKPQNPLDDSILRWKKAITLFFSESFLTRLSRRLPSSPFRISSSSASWLPSSRRSSSNSDSVGAAECTNARLPTWTPFEPIETVRV